MDWQEIAKGFITPPEDLQQLLNIQQYTMKVVVEINLAALLVSVRSSLGDFHRWQRKRWNIGSKYAAVCVDPPVCWLGTSRANTSSEVNDWRQVHSLHLKHPRPPLTPRLLSFYCCRPVGKKRRRIWRCISVHLPQKLGRFASDPKEVEFFFFFSSCSTSASTRNSHEWWYFMQPSLGLFRPFRQLHPPHWRNKVFISSCSLETSRIEKRRTGVHVYFIIS